MKNDINQKAVAAALGHSHSMITVDTYTDIQAVIADCAKEMQGFIAEVHPYDRPDAEMLEKMFQETIAAEGYSAGSGKASEAVGGVHDFSDVDEMDGLGQWHMEA